MTAYFARKGDDADREGAGLVVRVDRDSFDKALDRLIFEASQQGSKPHQARHLLGRSIADLSAAPHAQKADVG